ncbi:MAG: MerR family transcriptional regulator [Clostridia bacterium]|nr:MerR family transcriptional regulator [Clostridia bacterium]
MSVGKVSKLTGVSVRTLHYYDEIGLLCPSEISDAGYRFYDDADVEFLQQIMFYRELEFTLEEIAQILSSSNYDKIQALQNQKHLLGLKQKRLKKLINLIDKTLKGESTMSFKEFDMSQMEKAKKEFAEEVKEKWGNTSAYAESEQRTKNYGSKEWTKINEKSSKIFLWFAQNTDKNSSEPEVLEMVKTWQDYITNNFYKCTNEILFSLADMYVYDERFKNNIDQFGEGTAQFMRDAIKEYCRLHG